MTRKEKNYRVFCYFNLRRLNSGRTIISIKTLEQYIQVPNYTIQHLVNLRRLISENHIDTVCEALTEQFGFSLEKPLTNKEVSDMNYYELFN